jgi:tryptophanyl-tRNA synthetase
MAVKSSNRRPRVLSGIQPSGTLHLGNYLGALRPWAARQEAKENYFNNLLEIYELLTGYDRRYIEEHFAGKGYAVLKQETAEVIIESLRPIRERFVALMADSSALDHILADGAERARAVADLKIQDVKRKVGLIVAPNTA